MKKYGSEGFVPSVTTQEHHPVFRSVLCDPRLVDCRVGLVVPVRPCLGKLRSRTADDLPLFKRGDIEMSEATGMSSSQRKRP